jgi:hypothetical protein
MEGVIVECPRRGNSNAAFVPPTGPAVEVDLGAGVFELSLLDTWNRKIYSLGYTQGSVQTFSSRIAPGVIRLVKVDRSPSAAPFGFDRGVDEPLRDGSQLGPRTPSCLTSFFGKLAC